MLIVIVSSIAITSPDTCSHPPTCANCSPPGPLIALLTVVSMDVTVATVRFRTWRRAGGERGGTRFRSGGRAAGRWWGGWGAGSGAGGREAEGWSRKDGGRRSTQQLEVE